MMIDQPEIWSNRIHPPSLARPLTSTIDTWDQSTQIDYPVSIAHVGRRPGWNIPSISVANESIATIRSSTNLRFVSPSVPTRAGMFPNPIIAPTVPNQPFMVVPNMAQSIKTDSSVQVSFFISVFTQSGNDFVQFAIFRDGAQISQIFPLTTSAAGIANSISGSYTDNHPTAARHLYDLRWLPGGTQATALYKNRTFQVQNLRAV